MIGRFLPLLVALPIIVGVLVLEQYVQYDDLRREPDADLPAYGDEKPFDPLPWNLLVCVLILACAGLVDQVLQLAQHRRFR